VICCDAPWLKSASWRWPPFDDQHGKSARGVLCS
jgi:hypothetical protein